MKVTDIKNTTCIPVVFFMFLVATESAFSFFGLDDVLAVFPAVQQVKMQSASVHHVLHMCVVRVPAGGAHYSDDAGNSCGDLRKIAKRNKHPALESPLHTGAANVARFPELAG